MTYKIIRFRFDADSETLVRGLTLEQAQAHCLRDDTRGDGWFDGYVEENGIDVDFTVLPPLGDDTDG